MRSIGGKATFTLTVSVNDASLGTTDATYPPGTYSISSGLSVSVTATPSGTNVFGYWLLDGVNVGSTSPYILTMNANHTLEAMFIACPVAGVEQFTNDHFQTADFTGWTQTNMVIDNGTCVNGPWGTGIAPYIGSYDASQGNNNNISLQQILATPVNVSCIVAGSTFTITAVDLGAVCLPATLNCRILYTDGTFTDVALSPTPGWTTYNLKPFLTAGKTIKGILFTATTSYGVPTCIVHVGQASLKV